MFNVHDWAYSILLYTVSVGFGIAYSVSRAMREPYTRDKQSGRFPRSFYMLPPTHFSLQRQGNRVGKKLHPTRIRAIKMTKSFQMFEGKIRSLKQHLQLMDIALSSANKICLKSKNEETTIAAALKSSVKKHPQLNIPNKQIDISRTITTSRIKINEQAIIELYAAFSDHLTSIVSELAHSASKLKILGLISAIHPETTRDNNKLSYKDIFELASYDAILDEISHRTFRKIENQRSTTKEVETFLNTLNLEIPEDIKNDAILFLGVRHLIIHNNSKADETFNNSNNKGIIKTNRGKIQINYQLSNAAIEKVTELCMLIDAEFVNKCLTQ